MGKQRSNELAHGHDQYSTRARSQRLGRLMNCQTCSSLLLKKLQTLPTSERKSTKVFESRSGQHHFERHWLVGLPEPAG